MYPYISGLDDRPRDNVVQYRITKTSRHWILWLMSYCPQCKHTSKMAMNCDLNLNINLNLRLRLRCVQKTVFRIVLCF